MHGVVASGGGGGVGSGGGDGLGCGWQRGSPGSGGVQFAGGWALQPMHPMLKAQAIRRQRYPGN